MAEARAVAKVARAQSSQQDGIPVRRTHIGTNVENPTEKGRIHGGEPRTNARGETRTTIYISGGGRVEQVAGTCMDVSMDTTMCVTRPGVSPLTKTGPSLWLLQQQHHPLSQQLHPLSLTVL